MIHPKSSPSLVRSPIKFLQNNNTIPSEEFSYSQQRRDFSEVQTIMNMFRLERLILPPDPSPSDPNPYFVLISSPEEEKLLVSTLLSSANHHHSLLKTRLILERLAIDISPSSSTSSPPSTSFPNTTYYLATIRVWIVYCEEDGTPHLFEGQLEGHFAFPTSFSSWISTLRVPSPSTPFSLLCPSSPFPLLSSCFLFNWETLFFPLGFGGDRSLSHLSSSCFAISFRTQPYSQLASMLLGNLFKHARFESHITVLLPSPSSASSSCASPPSPPSTPVPTSLPLETSSIQDQIEKFKRTCGELNCKPILIELETGQVPNQLMTGRWHVGSFSDVQNEVYSLAKDLVKHRFQVIRTKLEASPSSLETFDSSASTSSFSTSLPPPSLPVSEEEATAFFPSTNYFEFHIRLRLKRDRNIEEGNREVPAENTVKEREERKKLLDLVRPFGGHLSRSAFKLLSEEEEHRFVTLRLYHLGKKSAYEKLEQTLEALRSEGYVIDGTQREYAVMDSNVSLDAGWIEPSTSSSASPPSPSSCSCSFQSGPCSFVSSSCSSSCSHLAFPSSVTTIPLSS